jgi:pyruvate dehydrogenase phosphatase
VTVDYIVDALPAELKGRLVSIVSFAAPIPVDAVSRTIQDAISSVDNAIARDLLSLFPGGVDSLVKMTDEDIKAIINDKDRGAVNICKVLRAQHGSTALLVLQDPSRENIWIAGLGDCSASTSCTLLVTFALDNDE